ncbi:uncharacterized protein TNCT_331601 [Trichonephila clavata]|uniref:Uncharacterized protein n=1 Tax=Trichonephila clavata TaxID=2740835 RepID=A0A8X6KBJ3_TRICU|nr:uncharacterized protein TNCT_331601 [Trichonephila clavata]
MTSTMWIYGIAVITMMAISFGNAKPMELEQFMSALSSTKNDDDDSKIEEPSQPKQQELFQFMKRSGLVSPSGDPNENQKILSALQALSRKQNLLVYSPEYAQPSNLVTMQKTSPRSNKLAYSSYQNPSTQEPSSIKDQQAALAALQSLAQQRSYSSQYSDPSSSQPQSSSQTAADSSSNTAYSTNQKAAGASNDKVILKDDRQGHYGYEGHSLSAGYDPGYSGNVLGHARNPGGYEADHYSHEPVGYNKHIALPVPSVSIKFDPLGLLKLLLAGIPRPLFNLNGRVFLG